jgi:hypothetical protein
VTTPDAGVTPRVEAARYRIDFGRAAAGGRGLLEFGPGDRVCLTIGIDLPKAAHLHRRSGFPGPDGILVTFFEPPQRGRRHYCTDNPDVRDAAFVQARLPRVYVDLHYSPRDKGVVGRLTPVS